MAEQMNSEGYFTEVRKQLLLHFTGIANGQKVVAEDKTRMEGFMRAGVVLDITSFQELQKIVEEIHQKVFGESIAARRSRKSSRLPEVRVDYGQYDSPSITRMKKRK
jgi:hypothetical protein